MDLSPLGVRATAGTLRAAEGVVMHQVWTDDGVVAGPAGNGGMFGGWAAWSLRMAHGSRRLANKCDPVPAATSLMAASPKPASP